MSKILKKGKTWHYSLEKCSKRLIIVKSQAELWEVMEESYTLFSKVASNCNKRKKLKKASKMLLLLKRFLFLCNMCKEKLEISSDDLEKYTSILSRYLSILIEISFTTSSLGDSQRCADMTTFLVLHLKGSPEHLLDSVLRVVKVFKKCSDLWSPLYWKVWQLAEKNLNDSLYLKCLLLVKSWTQNLKKAKREPYINSAKALPVDSLSRKWINRQLKDVGASKIVKKKKMTKLILNSLKVNVRKSLKKAFYGKLSEAEVLQPTKLSEAAVDLPSGKVNETTAVMWFEDRKGNLNVEIEDVNYASENDVDASENIDNVSHKKNTNKKNETVSNLDHAMLEYRSDSSVDDGEDANDAEENASDVNEKDEVNEVDDHVENFDDKKNENTKNLNLTKGDIGSVVSADDAKDVNDADENYCDESDGVVNEIDEESEADENDCDESDGVINENDEESEADENVGILFDKKIANKRSLDHTKRECRSDSSVDDDNEDANDAEVNNGDESDGNINENDEVNESDEKVKNFSDKTSANKKSETISGLNQANCVYRSDSSVDDNVSYNSIESSCDSFEKADAISTNEDDQANSKGFVVNAVDVKTNSLENAKTMPPRILQVQEDCDIDSNGEKGEANLQKMENRENAFSIESENESDGSVEFGKRKKKLSAFRGSSRKNFTLAIESDDQNYECEPKAIEKRVTKHTLEILETSDLNESSESKNESKCSKENDKGTESKKSDVSSEDEVCKKLDFVEESVLEMTDDENDTSDDIKDEPVILSNVIMESPTVLVKRVSEIFEGKTNNCTPKKTLFPEQERSAIKSSSKLILGSLTRKSLRSHDALFSPKSNSDKLTINGILSQTNEDFLQSNVSQTSSPQKSIASILKNIPSLLENETPSPQKGITSPLKCIPSPQKSLISPQKTLLSSQIRRLTPQKDFLLADKSRTPSPQESFSSPKKSETSSPQKDFSSPKKSGTASPFRNESPASRKMLSLDQKDKTPSPQKIQNSLKRASSDTSSFRGSVDDLISLSGTENEESAPKVAKRTSKRISTPVSTIRLRSRINQNSISRIEEVDESSESAISSELQKNVTDLESDEEIVKETPKKALARVKSTPTTATRLRSRRGSVLSEIEEEKESEPLAPKSKRIKVSTPSIEVKRKEGRSQSVSPTDVRYSKRLRDRNVQTVATSRIKPISRKQDPTTVAVLVKRLEDEYPNFSNNRYFIKPDIGSADSKLRKSGSVDRFNRDRHDVGNVTPVLLSCESPQSSNSFQKSPFTSEDFENYQTIKKLPCTALGTPKRRSSLLLGSELKNSSPKTDESDSKFLNSLPRSCKTVYGLRPKK